VGQQRRPATSDFGWYTARAWMLPPGDPFTRLQLPPHGHEYSVCTPSARCPHPVFPPCTLGFSWSLLHLQAWTGSFAWTAVPSACCTSRLWPACTGSTVRAPAWLLALLAPLGSPRAAGSSRGFLADSQDYVLECTPCVILALFSVCAAPSCLPFGCHCIIPMPLPTLPCRASHRHAVTPSVTPYV
jgi:hypothetical protein